MPEDQVKIKKESYESDGMVRCSDGSHYPHGTSLNFDDDMIEELGVGSLAVGDIVEVRGYAFVERKSEHSDSDGTDKNLSFQFTSIKMERETGDRAVQMYGPES